MGTCTVAARSEAQAAEARPCAAMAAWPRSLHECYNMSAARCCCAQQPPAPHASAALSPPAQRLRRQGIDAAGVIHPYSDCAPLPAWCQLGWDGRLDDLIGQGRQLTNPPSGTLPCTRRQAGRRAGQRAGRHVGRPAASARRAPAASVQVMRAGDGIHHAAAAEEGPAGSPQHSTVWSISRPQMKRPHWEADSME